METTKQNKTSQYINTQTRFPLLLSGVAWVTIADIVCKIAAATAKLCCKKEREENIGANNLYV